MWRRVLDLLTRTRRPLVFFDFETSGLSGAPPVEFAALVWAPWCEPEMDPLSVRAREAAPPGLWMASAGRLNPGRKIDPGAGRVHGITDADVAKAPRWDDIEQRAFWRALAEGSGDELPGRRPCDTAGQWTTVPACRRHGPSARPAASGTGGIGIPSRCAR